jgi:histone H3/H4
MGIKKSMDRKLEEEIGEIEEEITERQQKLKGLKSRSKSRSKIRGGKRSGQMEEEPNPVPKKPKKGNKKKNRTDKRVKSSRVAKNKQSKKQPQNGKKKGRRSKSQPSRPNVPEVREIGRQVIQHKLALAPFQKLVHEIAREYNSDIRLSREAMLMLKTTSETFLMGFFSKAYEITMCSKRVTLMKRDLDALCSIVNLEKCKMKFLTKNIN